MTGLTIKVHGLENFTDEEKVRIQLILNKMAPVLEWKPFQEAMQAAHFTENKGLSGADIVRLILSGADGPDFKPDGVLDFYIVGFKDNSNTIAYTYIHTFKQWLNRKYLNSLDEPALAADFIHELLHRAYSFYHRWYKRTSVPYLSGTILNKYYALYYQRSRERLTEPCLRIEVL